MDKRLLKLICYILAPLALVSMELFHPSGYGRAIYDNLLPHAGWWLQLHFLQPLFFSLVGVGGILLSWGNHGIFSHISKISLFLFIVYYSVYDAVAGIGTGVLIDVVKDLPEASIPLGKEIIQSYFFHPIFGGSHTWLSEFASLTWLVGIWSLAIALLIERRSILPILFLVLSGAFIWHNHGYPTGPMGFSCFFIAAIWLGYTPKPRIMPVIKD